MKKRTYRTKNVNKIHWVELKERLSGEVVSLAIDVAKEHQYAALSDEAADVLELMRWKHPEQTPELLDALRTLGCPVVVIMESTSTYGDALRYQFRALGYTIHQASAKRVHDASEVYDGVPSLHDAKSASILSRFYRDGLTNVWVEPNEDERKLNALRREYELHQSQYQRNQNRLEAYLSRHWPEVGRYLSLDSAALEGLLEQYGSAQQIACHASQAVELMRSRGGNLLCRDKIDRVIESATTTLGVPCTEAESEYLQALAREMKHSRQQKSRAKRAMEAAIDAQPELEEMSRLLGRVTTAVMLSLALDPRKYPCARAYQKAMGLNLKEKSSGRYVGQLKLTKRGSARARTYLYFAALRLLQNDAWVKRWYQAKLDPRMKMKTVIALMRKLSKAIWHIARGEKFDAKKLLSLPELAAEQ
ncbi:transposase [bacterium]|nr:transposase [bacterium]